MSRLEFKPQDRQSIDFAEEERKKSNDSSIGAIVHKKEKGYVSLNSVQCWIDQKSDIVSASFNHKVLKNFTIDGEKLVCQKEGLYMIFCAVIVERNDTSASNTSFYISKNNSAICETSCRGQVNGKKTPMSLMTIQDLKKGDYIKSYMGSDNTGCVASMQDPQIVIMEV